MKKSKVILPAMALLLFSTAASITGTVAWFSATRVFNTSAAQFGINTIDGNLEAEIVARVGTEALDENGDVTTTATEAVGVRAFDNEETAATGRIANRLYHGSVDWAQADPIGWTLNRDAKADGSDRYVSKLGETAANTKYAASKTDATGWFLRSADETKEGKTTSYNYYVAFSWQITLKYKFGSGESKIGIFLDTKESNFSTPEVIRGAQHESEQKTATGLRIALIPTAGFVTDTNHSVVFANSNNSANGYINKAQSDGFTVPGEGEDPDTVYNQGSYVVPPSADDGSGNYLVHNNTARIATDTISVTNAHKRSERLADVTPTDGAGTLRILCVAWYEGEDPGVITDAEMNSVTTNLTFYSRQIVAD